MREILLKVDKLKVKGNGKEILKRVNLQIKRGEIQALLGPNASGKSTLAQVILGNPKYKITQGRIFFEGKEITKLFPEKRARLGIAMAWQSPPAIKGVKFSQLLSKISTFRGSTSRAVAKGEEEDKSSSPTRATAKGKEEDLSSSPSKGYRLGEVEPHLLEREINVDFSGGEKKMSELVQVIALNPKLVIFDEIDSGLDIKRLEKAAKIIKKELVDKKVSILLITHSGAILNFLRPNITNVMVDGKIICREKDYKKVLKIIKKYGYEKCKKCKLLAG